MKTKQILTQLTGPIYTPSVKSLQFRNENMALDLLEFCEGMPTIHKADKFFNLRMHTLNRDEQLKVIARAKDLATFKF